MTKLLEEAIATLRALPERDQDTAAKFLLGFTNPDAHRYQLADDQVAEVEAALREDALATDAEMAEIWRRFDR